MLTYYGVMAAKVNGKTLWKGTNYELGKDDIMDEYTEDIDNEEHLPSWLEGRCFCRSETATAIDGRG